MNSSISYCGLDCSGCTVYLLLKEDNLSKNDQMISEIIRACKEHYNIDYNLEEINGCDGCKSDNGILFSSC